MLPGGVVVYNELRMRRFPGVKIRVDNSFLLGDGKGEEKVMQCYDIVTVNSN